MKSIVLLLFLFAVKVSMAQTDSVFQWSDSSFQVGQTIELSKPLFRGTSPIRFHISPPKQLDTLAAFLHKHDSLEIQIESHTDTRGSESKNKWITINQGVKIVRYLRKKGIEPSRMIIAGYGEEKNRIPLDSINQFKTTDRETFYRLHGLNRRNTIRITQNYGERRYSDYTDSLRKEVTTIRLDSTEVTTTKLGIIDFEGEKYTVLIQQGTELQLLGYSTMHPLNFQHYQMLKIIDLEGREVCCFYISKEELPFNNGTLGISLQPTPLNEPAANPFGWTLLINENHYQVAGY